MRKLTLKELQTAKPHSILRTGTAQIPMHWDVNSEEKAKFIVQRGGIDDWSIYFVSKSILLSFNIDSKLLDSVTTEWISRNGQKIYSGQITNKGKNLVKKLVPCEDSVFERYRD